MNLVKRKGITTVKRLPSNFEKLKRQFLTDVRSMIVMEDEVKCFVKVACENGSIVNTHGENPDWLLNREIKTHDSESRGQEEAGLRNERVCYLQVAPL